MQGRSAKVMSKIVFGHRGCSNTKFSKSVNSFGFKVFVRSCFSVMAVDCTKSQNEFETKPVTCTKGSFHGTEKFHDILTLVTSEAMIFNEFSSVARISLLAALASHMII